MNNMNGKCKKCDIHEKGVVVQRNREKIWTSEVLVGYTIILIIV